MCDSLFVLGFAICVKKTSERFWSKNCHYFSFSICTSYVQQESITVSVLDNICYAWKSYRYVFDASKKQHFDRRK